MLDVFKKIYSKGKFFQDNFTKLSKEYDLNIPVDGYPAKIRLQFIDENGNDSLLLRSLFSQENIKNGIFFGQGPIFHTFSHSNDDAQKTFNSIEEAFKIQKNITKSTDAKKMLNGKQMNRVLNFPI